MGHNHNDDKHTMPNRKVSAYDSAKKPNGFARLDPSKMGLYMPDWLAESSTVSSPREQRQSDGAPSADVTSQPRTVLEGMKVVCICKGIQKRLFWKALDEGAQTKEEINRVTGSGSGGCQGRRCGPRILDMLRNRPA